VHSAPHRLGIQVEHLADGDEAIRPGGIRVVEPRQRVAVGLDPLMGPDPGLGGDEVVHRLLEDGAQQAFLRRELAAGQVVPVVGGIGRVGPAAGQEARRDGGRPAASAPSILARDRPLVHWRRHRNGSAWPTVTPSRKAVTAIGRICRQALPEERASGHGGMRRAMTHRGAISSGPGTSSGGIARSARGPGGRRGWGPSRTVGTRRPADPSLGIRAEHDPVRAQTNVAQSGAPRIPQEQRGLPRGLGYLGPMPH